MFCLLFACVALHLVFIPPIPTIFSVSSGFFSYSYTPCCHPVHHHRTAPHRTGTDGDRGDSNKAHRSTFVLPRRKKNQYRSLNGERQLEGNRS
ncbi:hypothetical protein B0H13DRAFT_2044704 [Mycena leptocephala]|nr:hypothetical protein B0H13DRAFT_2044704 [Mycena leptocephala]